MSGPATERGFQHPDEGLEHKSDGSQFDVPAWRESIETKISSIDAAVNTQTYISTDNSSTTLITNGNNFTGTWEDVTKYNSVVVAVKTDQDGYFEIQFSPDGTNVDSTLTRYYRTSQIEAPHRFTITRQYFRVIFYNNSGSDQTFLRLQTTIGEKLDLNSPTDSVMSQDFDAISVRPTDYTAEVALGRRQGAATWNKFGYNDDVDTGTSEVLASFGGAFNQKLSSGETLSIVSTSANDTNSSGTGVRQAIIFGVDSNWDQVTEVIALNGLTPVVTSNSYLGVNRLTIYSSGSLDSNDGTITATASTSGNVMAEMPAGLGTSQQCIFYVPRNHQFLATWLKINVIKSSGGGSPEVTFKGWVYSDVVSSKFEIYRDTIDLSGSNGDRIVLNPAEPFVVGEKSIFWLDSTTTANNTKVRGRFSGKLIRDADA